MQIRHRAVRDFVRLFLEWTNGESSQLGDLCRGDYCRRCGQSGPVDMCFGNMVPIGRAELFAVTNSHKIVSHQPARCRHTIDS
jgi:hypothetical protein